MVATRVLAMGGSMRSEPSRRWTWRTRWTYQPVLAAIALCMVAGSSVVGCGGSPDEAAVAVVDTETAPGTAVTDIGDDAEPRGLLLNTPDAAPGYIYFAPLLSGTTYLIETVSGAVVRTWDSELLPSAFVYLLANGHVLRGGREPDVAVFSGGGQGGRIQEFTWEGDLVWDYRLASETHLLHHDVTVLPNGNILAIAWEAKSRQETQQIGMRPEMTPEGGVWPDMILELEPRRPEGARIVWEWHAWDHMMQNRDPALADYGDPAAHPELIDINGGRPTPEALIDDADELARYRELGYVPDDSEHDPSADLMHMNAIEYNAAVDQIAISNHEYHEIWIIDHSTTTAEAAGHTGGRWGRGGDLLYRWGNPRAYGRGDETDQRTFGQHDVRWIPDGLPSAGNMLVFSNNVPGPDGPHSEVFEITPPTDEAGRYVLNGADPFGPTTPTWSYAASDPTSFYSPFISGAHRLPDGHTLITSGGPGHVFELTPEGQIVWDYRSPYSGDVDPADETMRFLARQWPYAAFRATKLLPDHPALRGRDLAPLDPQPPIVGPPSLSDAEP